jgi:phage shock protein A
MAGKLVEQVNRLIRAGIAGVTEELRDPSANVERSLHLLRDRLGRTFVERRRLARKLAELPGNISELSGKAEVAVRKGRDDLARAAMAEIGAMERDREALDEDIAGLDEDARLLEQAIAHFSGEKRAFSDQAENATLRALIAELDRLGQTEHRGTDEQP